MILSPNRVGESNDSGPPLLQSLSRTLAFLFSPSISRSISPSVRFYLVTFDSHMLSFFPPLGSFQDWSPPPSFRSVPLPPSVSPLIFFLLSFNIGTVSSSEPFESDPPFPQALLSLWFFLRSGLSLVLPPIHLLTLFPLLLFLNGLVAFPFLSRTFTLTSYF